ncbi:hypothetical protein TWF217_003880 [Orbilia oligospora]|nr:hypothetical protein TWF751_007104 [Orbilia oligospora]KAF3272065.1 hypothetical protein TWF217_003880 [Orbilia oligospora]KAF3297768.1 hypothetical protein TWF132_006165 [Orbilia oligospora]
MHPSYNSSGPSQADLPAGQHPRIFPRVPLGDWDATNNGSRYWNGTLPNGGDPEARITLVMVTLWLLVGVGVGLVFWFLWRREYARAHAIVREEAILAAAAAVAAVTATTATATTAGEDIPLEEV